MHSDRNISLSLSYFASFLLQNCQQKNTQTNQANSTGGESKRQGGRGSILQQQSEDKILQPQPQLPASPTVTMCVASVRTLSMREDSEQSFQHQGEGVCQQGPHGRGQGSAWGSQGPLGCWDNCSHGLAEVTRPQDNGGDI